MLIYVEQNLIVGNSADQGDAGGFIVSNAGTGSRRQFAVGEWPDG